MSAYWIVAALIATAAAWLVLSAIVGTLQGLYLGWRDVRAYRTEMRSRLFD